MALRGVDIMEVGVYSQGVISSSTIWLGFYDVYVNSALWMKGLHTHTYF